MTTQNPWKTHSTRTIYQNHWITVREDTVTKPNGEPGIYSVVSGRAATGVVAMTPDNKVYLVGQYRYPTEMYSWEIPEGGADAHETPLDAIKRELREEAGIMAKKWQQLGNEVHLSNCFSDERAYLFLAQDLTEVEKDPDDTEVLQVKCIPFQDALSMVERGEIYDAVTIIALYRAQKVLAL